MTSPARSSSPFSSASSPIPLSSSPPSSPRPDFEDDRTSERAGDPFAASAKGTRYLKHYYKQDSATYPPLDEDSIHRDKRRRVSNASSFVPTYSFDSGYGESSGSRPPEGDPLEPSLTDMISRAIEEGNGIIDFSDQHLISIPATDEDIRSLKNFFTLSDSTTRLPAVRSRNDRTFTRTLSTLGLDPSKLQLLLANNLISRLPRALWELDNLVFLDLRNNSLRLIPPEIGQMTRLESLNLAGNRIEFLPSEITNLAALKKLLIVPNPLKPLERTYGRTFSRAFSGRELSTRRAVSSVQTLTTPRRVHTLDDLCLLYIIGGVSGEVEGMMNPLELAEDPRVTGSHLAAKFEVLVPGFPSLPSTPQLPEAQRDSLSIRVCPNPNHGERRRYISPVEERFTWETKASPSCETSGELIPIRWHGCSQGCLAFLEPLKQATQPATATELPDENSEAPISTQGEGDETDEDELPTVQVGGLTDALNFDDFD
ncbi:hypothetical protein DL96DRAFT_1583261 [Flagelloscypha sp. PMI_526]|nr:hypothetical protein DL96DRAFT_1583261 [Flagelloscypha sp. PMI_526]